MRIFKHYAVFRKSDDTYYDFNHWMANKPWTEIPVSTTSDKESIDYTYNVLTEVKKFSKDDIVVHELTVLDSYNSDYSNE